ncbi:MULTISPECIES: cyclic pyranopterin monophosphate synthase MoaC [Archaeoglobus]|jgi:cyclic pyranopterin phosphate synthase|uniref:Probable cyclic pyranopterin monophosphate synthase n=2 Tax=Archaeoglobus fulgidus TaxID=2234 RepID=MOAC_ARCFU|nr:MULTISPECIES: cyclic pyranopterin monophosphate synthase MoaC [Archaeoglobus]O28132.1 RecName: Full=Probable cyclic pyranopterin monophosphate synthase; AltName: Full=Molybdenum cofactor biosynthesis protein C [Archaeoglobus fulgidus DSM 4304]AAB89105.1 molybdenum cofactor biosynthesis protein (moaC) [Archaeoglobus fulgidus DSM 4304]KUJ92973.1 MAG: putative cyclic pyranopterin monophosphate synthase accessory protein [Archaeoglobus fulgidus]KUK06440.1 MAG: putative cyclic pyranopterin monoph
MELTHIEDGKVRMVDVSHKDDVDRIAVAEGYIRLRSSTIEAIINKEVAKGNVIAAANIAGVMAVKKTPELIPMCHPIPITSVKFDFDIESVGIRVKCTVKSKGKTGVEMEALTGVSVALLTIWDMVKSLEKDERGNYPKTLIEVIRVVEKVKGGKE